METSNSTTEFQIKYSDDESSHELTKDDLANGNGHDTALCDLFASWKRRKESEYDTQIKLCLAWNRPTDDDPIAEFLKPIQEQTLPFSVAAYSFDGEVFWSAESLPPKTWRKFNLAELVKTIMNVSFRYAVTNKVIQTSPVDGIGLPKAEKPQQRSGFRTRKIDTQKTLTMEQILILLEKSKDTPIHMQVMFNVLMGLRRSEINGVKYSDVDYINRTLKVECQLGRVHNAAKEDFAPKTLTKQEVGLKTKSSYREIPIPDYVFEAILKERQVYEKNRNRRKKEFQGLDYICCSNLGRARSKGFHCRYYKQLLAENGLPDIRWHDLRSTYCTLLLKESFNPKAVSKLMGHAKELITMDVYADNRGIIADGVPEMLEIVADVTEFLPDAGWKRTKVRFSSIQIS